MALGRPADGLTVRLLALDTSGPVVTAAVHDGDRVLAEHDVADARRHAELLAPAVAAVLDEAGVPRAELTGVAVGVGPGPFTGLRVGLVTALVLGDVLGVPVHGVCSLDAIAESAAVALGERLPERFVVATDARRREVYWAVYSAGTAPSQPPGARWSREGGPAVDAPAEVARAAAGLPVVGRGADLYPDVLGPALDAPRDVGAGALAAVAVRALAADGAGLLAPEPLYLRRPDAAPPGERKRVLR